MESLNKHRWLVRIGLAAALAAVAACTTVFRTQATKEVDALNLNLPDLVRAKAEADPGVAQQVRAGHESGLQQAVAKESHLSSIYSAQFGEKFRFVSDHAAAADHAALMETLNASVADGLNPSNFQADQLKEHGEAIASRQKDVLAACQISMSDEQKQALVEHMTEASKKDAAPELTGPAILDWMLDPKHADKYPDVQAAFEKTKAAVVARGKAEDESELGDAVAYFKYLRAMGLKDEMLLPNWETSLKDFPGAMAQAVPNSPHYLRLREELARYMKLAKKYPDLDTLKIAPAAKIKQGASGELIKAVQERMEMTGFYNGTVTGTFDEATKEALVEFQEAHQVVPDGYIGKGTIDSMNVPFDTRVRQIRLALAKQRRSGSRWEKYYVRVNIPEFMVEVVEDGKILRRHKVIVGNLTTINNTPEFEAKIQKIVYNPAWFITPRIFKMEEFPKWEADEEYFTKKGYKANFNKNGTPVAAYQPPGPGNALGRVKILFPNPNDVYLHDTPTKYLFARTQRAFSHGCIRLQNPLDMAEFLLKHDNNPAADEIDNILAKFGTREIVLQKPVPIFIEYSTVSTNEEGRAVFLLDIYKRDVDALANLDNPI